MGEQMRIVIAELSKDPAQPAPVYHIPVGPVTDGAEWQPVRCGGGIVFPGYQEKVPRSRVCPECLSDPQPEGEEP